MEAPVTDGFTKRFDIPLAHLDFSYVKTCSNVKELEKILKVLRSNEEGHYPQLEKCCEDKLTALSPNSRVLRKDRPVATKGDLDQDEREELDNDLKSWSSDMRFVDGEISAPNFIEEDTELPPIRSGTITLTADGATSSTETTKSTKKAMPREYRDWDKIDIDKELDKVDEQDSSKKQKTVVGNREVTNIPDQVNVTGLTEQEKLIKANREKDKGNEAFRSGDYKEAISYYSRSITLQPTAASYNNRALAYLKHQDWQKAIIDTNTVMKIEPNNVKALLRRGSAYKGLKQYTKAKADLSSVIELEPKNKKAQELLQDMEKIIEKERLERKTKGKRLVIEDVDGDEDEEVEEMEAETPNITEITKEPESKTESSAEKKQPRRMQIEEESDSDEEDEGETENLKSRDSPVLNGHLSPRGETSNEKKVSGIQDTNSEAHNITDIKEQTVDKSESSKVKTGDAKPDKDASECDNYSNVSAGKNSVKGNDSEPSSESVELLGDIAKVNKSKSSTESDESSEDEFTDAKEDLSNSKPVIEDKQSNKTNEIDNTDNTSSDDNDSKESEASENSGNEDNTVSSEDHVLRRPVIYKMEYPDTCVRMREEANNCFKNGQYGEGCGKYSKLIAILEKDPGQTVNLSLTYSNRAACHLKTGDLPSAVKDCTKSLELVPHSFKPLLRRAMAYEHLERYDRAYVDYRHILLIDGTVQQAHLGTKRCQEFLSKKDGKKWREKVKLTQVSQWEIPDIRDVKEKDLSAENVRPVAAVSTGADKPQQAVTETVREKKEEEKPKEKTLSPKEKFEKVKTQGNDFVKQSKFREAVQCYTECSEILPDETVPYTNRALCYIRLNQADKAEADCTRVLEADKDNVKALFRRAQARKMLQNYSDGIKDLKHLLDIEPKNGPAKKEMELMKNYWREQLQNMKKDMPTAKSSSKPADGKGNTPPEKKDSRSRKRMVIEEVESDEESTPTKDLKGNKKDERPKSATSKPKAKIEEVKNVKVPQSVKPETKQQGTSTDTKSTKLSKAAAKKTAIKETSSGLPRVPKSVPKLEKATPYEFISAWNSLKKAETVKPYYELLRQINPDDVTTVISNKLDGDMLKTIVKCVSQHFLKDGHVDTSYQLLHNLSKVPRFGTVSMFMSKEEKSDVTNVMDKLTEQTSSVYTPAEVQKLRKAYSV